MQQPAPNPAQDYWFAYSAQLPTLGQAWIEACKKAGNRLFLRDTLGTELTATKALVGSIVLSRHIGRLSPEQNVALLLPGSAASVLCNMACMLLGKTVINLNFTATPAALRSSLQQADIRTIYTSARFLERLESRGIDTRVLYDHANVVLLEDLRALTSTAQKLLLLAECTLSTAGRLQRRYCREHDPDQNATILFSSGSEGQPKGVMLSHRSILANVKQTGLLLRLANDDLILANLPPFHAFGLTATYFLPLLEGASIICHADPTDALATAQAIKQHKVTIMFSTSTFLRLHVKNSKVQPDQLASLRLVVAGAEKLQADVREAFSEKFGKEVYEGYGATETAPVASCNLPESKRPAWVPQGPLNKIGSVGRPLPGTRFRIVDPDNFEELPLGDAGMILISGPQVMHGYLHDEERTRHVIRIVDATRWYMSGDKGYLDEDGFLFIQDRYSRFAKIAGEMVSMSSIEEALRACLDDPELDLLVVSLPCERKGEKLVALSTLPLDMKVLRDQLLACGLNNLSLPGIAFTVDAIPKLGSGKTDFSGAKTLAAQLCEAL